MKADIKFHFLTAVWGEAYVETFLSVALPNQLSPGNIPSLRSLDRCIYKIFTTDEDAERIKAAPALKSLVNLMPVEVVTMRGVDLNASKYDLSTQCYRQGIHDADKVGAAIFQVPPGRAWSKKHLCRCSRIITGRQIGIVLPSRREILVPQFCGIFIQL
jgi:hypothetical protein